MKTKLIAIRKPTPKERKENNAEIVFEREAEHGRIHIIYAAKCHESWEQWGALRDVLSDNVDTVEKWRRGELEL